MAALEADKLALAEILFKYHVAMTAGAGSKQNHASPLQCLPVSAAEARTVSHQSTARAMDGAQQPRCGPRFQRDASWFVRWGHYQTVARQ